MCSCNTNHLTWVSPTLGMGYLSCSTKAQLLLLTLDEGYLPTAAIPDLQCWIAPLGPPAPAQPPLLLGMLLPATTPSLELGVAPQGHRPWPRAEVSPPSCCPWPRARGGFPWLPLTSDTGCLLPAATDLGRGVAPLSRCP